MIPHHVEQWLAGQGCPDLARPQLGSLLVAMPALSDSTFDRTVVLLIGDFDGGYQGLILSEPGRSDVSVELPAWWAAAKPPRTVHRGGPCEPDLVMCLAVGGPGVAIPGVEFVTRYDASALYRIEGEVDPQVVQRAVSGLRLFSGYSGWSRGQLEAEIDSGAWVVVPSEPDDAVTERSATLWRDVLKRQVGPRGYLRSCPDDSLAN